jgi:hypothetical protein
MAEKGLRQKEQRLRMELRRQKSNLQNKISDAEVAKRIAEDPQETPTRRSQARTKYENLQKEVANARKAVADLDKEVKAEQSRKESLDIQANYDRLKGQYDLMLDKTTPEAESLAGRINAEVKKINKANQIAGISRRYEPITTGQDIQGTTSLGNRPKGATVAPATFVTGESALETTGTTGGVTGGTTGGTTGGVTGGVTGGKGGKDGKKVKDKRTAEQRYADAVSTAMEKYNMPDIVFRNVPSLGALLQKYVDKKLTDKQLLLEIQNDPWYRSNSAEIKARYVQQFNYDDLVKTGRAQGTTDYEQQLARITRNIQARARELNGIEIPDDQAKLLAKDLYIYNLDNDPAVLTERLAQYIRPSAGMIGGRITTGYGGQALQNYQQLQAIARANGFKIQDILPKDAMGRPMTAEGTLEQLALGKLDINRIAQDVRKLAAIGQPDYVKDLLGQGYDLENIYSPYKERMSTVLELDPNTISLNDPTLRMGISKEGDMNLYDFERALRQDSRWQYTSNARQDVSNAALQVLKDFGFQG